MELSRLEEYWRAVLARDRAFDGVFVFAVNTTGIYCRPSCAAKRPRRVNVAFFELPEAAARSGFRACKRCHPERTESSDPRAKFVRHVCRVIESRLDNMQRVNLEDLGKETGRSPFQLQRVFKNFLGVTPHEYAEALRLQRFKSKVKGGSTVTDAMMDAGYSSSSRLYEKAASQLGMSPAAYRHGGSGALIRYAIAGSPLGLGLGKILVAATEKGICAVSFADSDVELESLLKKEFPSATLKQDPGYLKEPLAKVVSHLRGETRTLDLPLDISATAFQWRVWNELRKIPYGSTRTYSDVASAIGSPGSARAVARACATNPTALVIPCHRVVRADHSASGYRWGAQRKQKLLAVEKA